MDAVSKAREYFGRMALDITNTIEKKLGITSRDTGATGREFCAYLIDTHKDPGLEERWREYSQR